MDRLQYTLTYNSVATILEYAPSGWDNSVLKTERSTTLWGISRTFNFQFEFVKDGADILRDAFYNNGIEAYVGLKIERFNYISWVYETLFDGEIDFKQFIDNEVTVKVAAFEGSLQKLLKANENTKYAIPYNRNYNHAQILADKYNFSNAQIDYTGTTALEYIFVKYPVKLTKTSELENIGGIVTVKDSTLTAGVQTGVLGYIFNEDNTFLTAEKDCAVKLDIDIKYFLERYYIEFDDYVNIWLRYDIELWKYDSLATNWVLLDRNRAEQYHENILSLTESNFFSNFKSVKNYNLKSGDKLAWQININYFTTGIGNPISGEVEDGYTLSTKCNITVGDESYNIPCINFQDLITNLSNKIVGNTTSLESTYFSDKNIIFFSGNAVRGVPNSVLNISFNDLFKFLNSCYSCGVGIEGGKILLENRSYFFEDAEVEKYDNCNDFSIEHAEEMIFNSVKIGNTSPAIEVKYGNYEPNNQFIFQLPIKKIEKQLDLISPIRTDSIGIEALRIFQSYSNTDNQDNSNDNEIFAVIVEDNTESICVAKFDDYTITSGVPSDIIDSVFNKSLTPKRSLIANSDLLNTAMYKQPQSNEVVFLTSTKNNLTVFSDETENESVLRSELNNAIFDPIIYNAIVPCSTETWKKIMDTPKGYFSIMSNSKEYQGFLLSADLKAASRSEMKLRLIAKTPANIEPPIYIPKPLFWIESSKSINYELIDNKVATVYDMSENKTNVVQSIVDARPTIETIGGKDYFKFDGIDDYLNGGNICDLNNPSHIFIIFKTNTQSKSQNIISRSLFGATPHRYTLGIISNYLYAFISADNSSAQLTVQSSNLYTSFKCVEFVKNNSNYVKLNENNILIDTDTQEYRFISNLTDYDFLIGAYNNTLGKTPPQSGYYFDGYIGEIIIYNEQLNETQRTMIYNYLRNKWGL